MDLLRYLLNRMVSSYQRRFLCFFLRMFASYAKSTKLVLSQCSIYCNFMLMHGYAICEQVTLFVGAARSVLLRNTELLVIRPISDFLHFGSRGKRRAVARIFSERVVLLGRLRCLPFHTSRPAQAGFSDLQRSDYFACDIRYRTENHCHSSF